MAICFVICAIGATNSETREHADDLLDVSKAPEELDFLQLFVMELFLIAHALQLAATALPVMRARRLILLQRHHPLQNNHNINTAALKVRSAQNYTRFYCVRAADRV